MLELGSSKPWQDAMEKITGQRHMDASGLIEYFKPLIDWLEADNAKNGEFIGWKRTAKSNDCFIFLLFFIDNKILVQNNYEIFLF